MATQVKEKVAIDHFKNNYDLHLDYLVIVNHDLKSQTIKPLKDIRLDKDLTLQGTLNALQTRIHLLEEENKVLLEENKATNEKIDNLTSVFENTIKELITR